MILEMDEREREREGDALDFVIAQLVNHSTSFVTTRYPL